MTRWSISQLTILLLLLVNTTLASSNSSLLWGTYRPNLYFGTRPRLPESIMTGLMWFDANDLQGFQRIRHACDQGDGIEGYGYHKHDGREFASQVIHDTPSNIKLSTEFIKIPEGKHGGDWGVRIRGAPINNEVPAVTSVMFYVGIEGEGGIDIMNKLSKKGLESPVRLEGDTPELGDFEIQIVDGPLNSYLGQGIDQDLSRTQWLGKEVPKGSIWRAKDFVGEHIVTNARQRIEDGTLTTDQIYSEPYKLLTLSNSLIEEEGQVANFYTFQKLFHGEFQVQVNRFDCIKSLNLICI
ncbi:hypothetical protein G6F43_009441 [Rhizopus delemar]|nr:hypothetical protein G6F43_009441 [Rhizopus delemar]